MRVKILLVTIGMSLSLFAFNPKPSLNQRRMSYGLIGDMVFHPGVFFRYDYDFLTLQKIKPKEKKKGNYDKVKTRSLYGTGNAGMFWHPRTQTSIYNLYGIGYRKEVKEKRFRNVDLSFGYQVNFLPNTYRVSDQFEVEETGVTTRAYGVVSMGWSYGRNLKSIPKTKDRLMPNVKNINGYSLGLRSNLLMNYNTAVVPTVQLELGITIGKRALNYKPTGTPDF